jgi:hypothetical protein
MMWPTDDDLMGVVKMLEQVRTTPAGEILNAS